MAVGAWLSEDPCCRITLPGSSTEKAQHNVVGSSLTVRTLFITTAVYVM